MTFNMFASAQLGTRNQGVCVACSQSLPTDRGVRVAAFLRSWCYRKKDKPFVVCIQKTAAFDSIWGIIVTAGAHVQYMRKYRTVRGR